MRPQLTCTWKKDLFPFLTGLLFTLLFPLALMAQTANVPKAKTKKNARFPAKNLSKATVAGAQYNFSMSTLKGTVLSNPTSLQFGPDNRLYVAQQGGVIKVFTVKRNGSNDYAVTATETIGLINQIPNHNDDGTLNTSVKTRQVTGILVKGTAANPVIYVSSSDSRIGGPSGDKNLDTNSGIISLLTWNGTAWVKLDLVRGLPRSEENHSTNGLQLDEINHILYVAQGGHTNAGSPSTNFAYTNEYALSAAILSIDLNVIEAMPTLGSGNTAYKYDLPTLDDPTRTNSSGSSDVNDPFGGNDGLNMARIVPGGPVQVYSPGFRNPYDLVITEARRMYSIDNGANQGWGGYPQYEGTDSVTNNYVSGEPGSTTATATEAKVNNLDNLEYIGNIDTYIPGSHYAGHPNPVRANPTGAGLYTNDSATVVVWRKSTTGPNPLPADWPPVPYADSRQGDFRMPGVEDSSLLTWNSSTNGIAEYTASNFNNALKGALLACGYDGAVYKISLTADGTGVTNTKSSTNRLDQDLPFASNFATNPLDVVCQGDSAVYPGTVWVAAYGPDSIYIFEPQDFVNCTGLYNAQDDDGDGYTNADEIDNGTNPCSAASIPADFDRDHISDLNDPDDDNDGLSDKTDFFAIDNQNGLATSLPISYDLFNNDPGTGFFGEGFTGLMSNGDSDYYNLYDDQNLIAGGAVGAFTISSVTAGDALGNLNTQKEAFQFGVKSNVSDGPFTVQSRLLGPFFNGHAPKDFESQGIYIGTGDQDNYLKIAINANGGTGGIEVVNENAGVAASTQYPIAGGIPGSTLDLYLSVDPATGKVQPRYSSNGGPVTDLGSPIQLTGNLLAKIQGTNTAYAVGVIATSRGADPFTATWDYINIANDPAPVVTADTGSWTTIVPTSGMDTAREENAYVQAGDKFYLMGGRSIKPAQEYDPVNKTWVDKAKPPIEINHFQGVTLNGLIYAAGAFNGKFPHEKPVANVYIFNPTANKWYTGPAIPAARQRGATGAVAYNGKLYLIGGILDGHWWGWVNWFDEYDPATNTWKILPDAPRVRDHFTAVIINDKIYVAGGRRSSDSTNQLFNLTIPEVDVYDFTTGKWSTLPSASNIPTQRAGASNVVLGDEVIVIGGESGTQVAAHTETEALNVTTNTWRSLAHLQQGRHGTGAIANNNGIYIVAGPGNRGGTPLLNTQEAFYFTTPTTPTGTALVQSQLSAPASVGFGTVPLNYDSVKTVTVSNTTGNQDILITAMTLSNTNAGFTFTAPYALPFVVPVGKSITISVHFKPTTATSQTANMVITHSGQGGSTTIALSGSSTSTSTGSGSVVYRINAGGLQVTNSIGTFLKDAYYTSSTSTYTTTKSIAGTPDTMIYKTERNPTTNNGTFSYNFKVASGNQYKVILHFAEIYFTAINKRVFDVSIEGVKVLDNYDIVKKVGAFTATTETFTTTVTDDTLTIYFSSLASDGGIYRPKVSAIEILNVTGSTSNQPPTANAGADQTITLPTNSVALNGSGSDMDGTIATYSWSQVSGPNTATFSDKAVAKPTVSGLIQGSYVFALTVTDDKGAVSAADQVTVTVNPAPTTTQVVSSFTLINADNGGSIQTLSNGDVINLGALPTKNLNIKATTIPYPVGSVVFNLSGAQSKTTVENTTPYALFGDKNGVYAAWVPPVGSYTLKATPYASSGGKGTAGTPLTVNFSVINQAPATVSNSRTTGEVDAQSLNGTLIKAYPNPSSDGQYNVLLSAATQGTVLYSLESISGTKVAVGKLTLPKPTSVLPFNFGQEMKAAGVYYLHLEVNNVKAVVKLMRL